MLLRISKKSSNFAAVIKTTQSFLYLKIKQTNTLRTKDAAKRPFSFLYGSPFSGQISQNGTLFSLPYTGGFCASISNFYESGKIQGWYTYPIGITQ